MRVRPERKRKLHCGAGHLGEPHSMQRFFELAINSHDKTSINDCTFRQPGFAGPKNKWVSPMLVVVVKTWLRH
jgi:hypothetical protein